MLPLLNRKSRYLNFPDHCSMSMGRYWRCQVAGFRRWFQTTVRGIGVAARRRHCCFAGAEKARQNCWIARPHRCLNSSPEIAVCPALMTTIAVFPPSWKTAGAEGGVTEAGESEEGERIATGAGRNMLG
ncbi:unnamed protein product [Cuscuta campestris]|uniref:Uncharacterized protein n=1 Tax=Cuscuta campestris TaxID=132261 RepID=A0A484N635_9ASTE|nr:unnamed protein product [Cuscuta campestris]